MGTSVSPWPEATPKGDKLCEPGITAFDIKTELVEQDNGLGLHSTTFWLNVSTFRGLGVAFRGYSEDVQEVTGGSGGSLGCISCQKGLKLS